MDEKRVKVVKLTTGEEFTAEVALRNGPDDDYFFTHPTCFSMSNQGLMARPFLMFGDHEKKPVRVREEFVVCVHDCEKDVVDIFIKQHSTIIQPAKGQLIV